MKYLSVFTFYYNPASFVDTALYPEPLPQTLCTPGAQVLDVVPGSVWLVPLHHCNTIQTGGNPYTINFIRWRTQGIVSFNFMTPLYPSSSPSQHSNVLQLKNIMHNHLVIRYHFRPK